MDCVIIAGGNATRLGVPTIPKSMIPINGVPILERQIFLAKQYGIKKFFILSGRLSCHIQGYFGDGSRFDVDITHIEEPFPLGTAGSVKLAQPFLQSRFLVFYGDIVMNFNLHKLIKFDKTHPSVYGTIVVHPNDHPYDSDIIKVGINNTIIGFSPKPHPKNFFYQNIVNAGVYILDPLIFNHIPSDSYTDFGKDIFPYIVQQERGNLFSAYKTAEYIKDMGTKERLKQVSYDVICGKVTKLHQDNARPAIFLDRDGVVCTNMNNSIDKTQFMLLPGVTKSIRKINQSGKLAIIITNQPGIAKGFFSEEDLEALHAYMETLLGNEGAYLDAIFYCPHYPEKGFVGERQELKTVCDCRKPQPGLFFSAMKQFNIDMEQSWMIGDNIVDMIAGKAAKCNTAFIGAVSASIPSYQYNLQADSLSEAIDIILK